MHQSIFRNVEAKGLEAGTNLEQVLDQESLAAADVEHAITGLEIEVLHDFTKAGGLMLHALPFTVHLEHGFFNYQPNLFDALARYNSYQTLGTWVGPDWSLSSLVPWEPKLLEFLTLNAKTTHLLVILQRKLHMRNSALRSRASMNPRCRKGRPTDISSWSTANTTA
jgi:hypothetical protein